MYWAPDGQDLDFLYSHKKSLRSFVCFCQGIPSTSLHARFCSHDCSKLRVEPTLQAARPVLSKGPRLFLVRFRSPFFATLASFSVPCFGVEIRDQIANFGSKFECQIWFPKWEPNLSSVINKNYIRGPKCGSQFRGQIWYPKWEPAPTLGGRGF